MAQYYQINLDDIKHLNLENYVIMNEDGTQFSPRSVNMTYAYIIFALHEMNLIHWQFVCVLVFEALRCSFHFEC